VTGYCIDIMMLRLTTVMISDIYVM
jgi:hypothetical protein